MFAKLYETPEYGQILVKLDVHPDENTPEVRYYIQPHNLGVCSYALGWPDTDEGWDKAEQWFALVDEEDAREKANTIQKQVAGLTK